MLPVNSIAGVFTSPFCQVQQKNERKGNTKNLKHTLMDTSFFNLSLIKTGLCHLEPPISFPGPNHRKIRTGYPILGKDHGER